MDNKNIHASTTIISHLIGKKAPTSSNDVVERLPANYCIKDNTSYLYICIISKYAYISLQTDLIAFVDKRIVTICRLSS